MKVGRGLHLNPHAVPGQQVVVIPGRTELGRHVERPGDNELGKVSARGVVQEVGGRPAPVRVSSAERRPAKSAAGHRNTTSGIGGADSTKNATLPPMTRARTACVPRRVRFFARGWARMNRTRGKNEGRSLHPSRCLTASKPPLLTKCRGASAPACPAAAGHASRCLWRRMPFIPPLQRCFRYFGPDNDLSGPFCLADSDYHTVGRR